MTYSGSTNNCKWQRFQITKKNQNKQTNKQTNKQQQQQNRMNWPTPPTKTTPITNKAISCLTLKQKVFKRSLANHNTGPGNFDRKLDTLYNMSTLTALKMFKASESGENGNPGGLASEPAAVSSVISSSYKQWNLVWINGSVLDCSTKSRGSLLRTNHNFPYQTRSLYNFM